MLLNSTNITYIIIVSYNGMSWISKCLESTKPYPVIVVDNCSTDGTADYIKDHHPDVILIKQQKNVGFGLANNIGISVALKMNANFVFLLNQDAFLKPNTISILVDNSLKHSEYGILSPVHLDVQGKDFEKIFHYYLKKGHEDIKMTDIQFNQGEEKILDIKMINAAAWLIPKKTLEIIGGFSPLFFLYGEDDNYCQRIKYHNLKIGICPNAYVVHDSGTTYHLDLKTGSEEYYKKYLNQVKVIGADVNGGKENIKQLQELQKQKIIKGLLKFRFRKVLIDFQKWLMIKDLDFSKEIDAEREKNSHYLEI